MTEVGNFIYLIAAATMQALAFLTWTINTIFCLMKGLQMAYNFIGSTISPLIKGIIFNKINTGFY